MAFARDPAPSGEYGSTAEYFNCAHLCRRGARLLKHERAARCCALPDFDAREWTFEKLYPIHMGAPPDYSRSPGVRGKDDRGDNDWTEPLEDIENEGCPGAWYRTAFVESLLRYRRRPCEGGGRVVNPLLDRCTDEWIIEAIAELERWEDAWSAEHIDAVFERAERKKGAQHGQ